MSNVVFLSYPNQAKARGPGGAHTVEQLIGKPPLYALCTYLLRARRLLPLLLEVMRAALTD